MKQLGGMDESKVAGSSPEGLAQPPAFLANMGLAQIQALGLLGYPLPFPALNFMPPNMNVPLDLSKSGYEPIVRQDTPAVVEQIQNLLPQEEPMETVQEPVTPDPDRSTGDSEMVPSPTSSPGIEHDDDRKPIQDRQRQKRQTLQDMTRPLKHWLYHHRDNPYPSKSEKVQLARSSQMTMTQVSNWFANARRRLKNTVRDPDLTWAKRIKLYNNYAEGNQELLSIGSSSSDDDVSAETGDKLRQTTPETGPVEMTPPSVTTEQQNVHQDNLLDRLTGDGQTVSQVTPSGGPSPLLDFSTIIHASQNMPVTIDNKPSVTAPEPQFVGSTNTTEHLQPPAPRVAHSGDEGSLDGEAPAKYKHAMMHRYLNDSYNSYQNALQSLNTPVSRDPKEKERHRNPSGSLSSHDYEEYMSSASSARSTPTREHQEGHIDEYEEFSRHWPDIKTRAEDDLYWKEISAALALTSLARSRYTTPSH